MGKELGLQLTTIKTDHEESALSAETLKNVINVAKSQNIKFIITSSFYSRGAISLSIVEKEAIDIVINLITKLEKENEERDTEITEINEYLEVISQCLDNIAIDQIPIAIAEIKWDNMLKDKYIDLMSEYIYSTQIECNVYYKNKEEVRDHFKKLAKEKGE